VDFHAAKKLAHLTALNLCAAALQIAVIAALLLLPSAATAHVLGVSRGDYTPDGSRVHVEIVLRADDAALAVSGLDADGDGRVSQGEADRGRGALKADFFDALGVSADGARCSASLDDALLDPPDGLRLRATFQCPVQPVRLHLRFGFLDQMPATHRHLATVHLRRGDVETLAVLARPEFEVDVSEAPSSGFMSLLRGGVEHILTGADHLAFLLALVLGGTLVPGKQTPEKRGVRAGPLVAMLTAFTVGHSTSLAIATLGGFAPGARFIEPAVALSVAYVGAENLFAKSVAHRWVITFPFGLVHGFALAGGLLPLGLPRTQLPGALLAFNLGVEVGQLAVLALLLPPLGALHSRSWYPRVARILSVGIVIAGLAWFVQRVV
jgi:hypothetical protein